MPSKQNQLQAIRPIGYMTMTISNTKFMRYKQWYSDHAHCHTVSKLPCRQQASLVDNKLPCRQQAKISVAPLIVSANSMARFETTLKTNVRIIKI